MKNTQIFTEIYLENFLVLHCDEAYIFMALELTGLCVKIYNISIVNRVL